MKKKPPFQFRLTSKEDLLFGVYAYSGYTNPLERALEGVDADSIKEVVFTIEASYLEAMVQCAHNFFTGDTTLLRMPCTCGLSFYAEDEAGNSVDCVDIDEFWLETLGTEPDKFNIVVDDVDAQITYGPFSLPDKFCKDSIEKLRRKIIRDCNRSKKGGKK